MNPLEALSPTIIAQLRAPENPTPAARAKYRARVSKQVVGCVACERSRECTPTAFSGSPAAKLVVVSGEGMTKEAARLLKALLREAGWGPNDTFMVYTAACLGEPHPTKTEVLACRENLVDQVEAAYLPYVLLAGAKAVDAWRSDVTITDNHGGVFVWLDKFVTMPTFHPMAALKGPKGFKTLIREDLERLHDIVFSGDNPLSFIGEQCYKCKADATMWDRDAVPMCDVHWKKNKGQWEKERRRWSESPAIQLTF